jgi:3-isopropylmalate/(R)-2-methylmalate dehydratase large subunit
MGQTISEKIISSHAKRSVHQGDIAVVSVDGCMATDATGPFAIKAFRDMGGTQVWDPDRVSLVLDHAAPAPNERIGNLHKMLRDFAREMGCNFFDVGEGICHQVIVDSEFVHPGEIFVGADSHTCTYGALNAFAIGVGSTDLAAVMLTGKIWLKVPETIKIYLTGSAPRGITAKDIILFLVGQVGIAGATYKAIEFTGSALNSMSLASRMTVANMAAEMGAKAGLVDPTGLELGYEFDAVYPDDDAQYEAVYSFDLSDLRPQVSVPHLPDKVVSISEVTGKKIDQAFVGSCTNARLEDLRIAAAVLKGKRIAPGVRLLIAPASKRVFDDALQDGTVQTLSQAGATFVTSGCGPCVGTHMGIPGDDEVIISSTNRNFRGRMGNPNASIYLGSPAVVAASALTGEITDPVEILADDDTAWELF